MKSPAAYYLLLIYITAFCRPVMPLLVNGTAHIFYKNQHIASVHSHAGKNHVSEAVGQLAQKENTNTNQVVNPSFTDVPLHLPVSIGIHFRSIQLLQAHSNHFAICFFPSVSLAIQLPPPRV